MITMFTVLNTLALGFVLWKLSSIVSAIEILDSNMDEFEVRQATPQQQDNDLDLKRNFDSRLKELREARFNSFKERVKQDVRQGQ